MGPGAGVHGGQVIAQGTADDVAASAASLTGKYLARVLRIPIPPTRHRVADDAETASLRIVNARGNNLKGVTAEIPVGLLTCVTGVSGSGQSTLVNDTLYAAVARKLYNSNVEPETQEENEGMDAFAMGLHVVPGPTDRSPIRYPHTTP